MEVRTQSKSGPVVAQLPQIVGRIAQQVDQQQQAWLEQLQADPSRFAQVEGEVHETFRQLADQVVAGLLAHSGHQSPALERAKKK